MTLKSWLKSFLLDIWFYKKKLIQLCFLKKIFLTFQVRRSADHGFNGNEIHRELIIVFEIQLKTIIYVMFSKNRAKNNKILRNLNFAYS